jgi:glucose-6-phosphate 1-dehydrogenase
VATPAAETMPSPTIRGRYTAGTIGTRQVPSHTGEPGADPARTTETCACLTLQVTSPRWDGVPFTVCLGNAPAAGSAAIAIHFRPLPRYLPGQWPGAEPNVLRLGLADSAFTSADHWHRPSTGEKDDPSAPPAKESGSHGTRPASPVASGQ